MGEVANLSPWLLDPMIFRRQRCKISLSNAYGLGGISFEINLHLGI